MLGGEWRERNLLQCKIIKYYFSITSILLIVYTWWLVWVGAGFLMIRGGVIGMVICGVMLGVVIGVEWVINLDNVEDKDGEKDEEA